ncbi:MAG: ATP-binding protein, partial [Halanaerobiaceae bacterium]
MTLNDLKNRLNPKTFFGKLFLSHILVTLITLFVIGFLVVYLIQNYFFGLNEWEAVNNSRRIASLVSESITGGTIENNVTNSTENKINTIARSSSMDIGLINSSGELILNVPEIDSSRLDLKNNEINHVLSGNTYSRKVSGPNQQDLLMVAPLVREEDSENLVALDPQSTEKNPEVTGAVIIRTSLGGISTTINNIIKYILFSLLIGLAASVLLTISFTRRVTKPLNQIKASALQTAQGKFEEVEVPKTGSREIRHLADTYNYAVSQIKETLKQKKKLDKMRREFVDNVSHEFRAPLTSIKGFMELLKEQDLKREEINKYINIMYKDTEYLEHLLTDLLDLGRLEEENLPLNKESVDPEYLISWTVESLENKLEKKDINLEIEMEDKLPEIEVDPNRIHQVLINLLENAINYSTKGGTIILAASRPENFGTEGSGKGQIEFAVTDEGPGIPEEEQENIFDRFYKIERARTREEINGSGLGLSIVRDIVEKHGG